MTEFIREFIGNDYWATVIMSIVPLIELKGGIVFARGTSSFGFLNALLLSYAGSIIVFIPIYFLLRPILNLLKKIKWFNGFANKVEGYFSQKAEETLKKQQSKLKQGNEGLTLSDEELEIKSQKKQTFIKQLGVFIFVAIPLPMTGVWTGTAIAVFLNLKFKDVILPVMIGNLVAGLIISLLAELLIAVASLEALDYVLYALLGLALILLVITIIKMSRTKTDKGDSEK